MDKSITIISAISDIEKSVTNAWESKNTLLVNDLVEEAKLLEKSCLEIGKTAYQSITTDSSFEEQYLGYQIVFEWLEMAKHFMIAWRNITFEQYKGVALLNDKKSSVSSLNNFKLESKKIILQAKDELITELNSYALEGVKHSPSTKKQLQKWVNLQNPYPIYKAQIHELTEQCELCYISLQALEKEQTYFHQIGKLIEDNTQKIQHQVQKLKATLNQLVKDLGQDGLSVEEQIIIVEQAELNIDFQNIEANFNTQLTTYLDQLIVKIDLPVGIQNGLMTKRELNMQRLAKSWVLAEIKPLLYEIWEVRDNITTGAKMIFMNLKNQLKIRVAQDSSVPNGNIINILTDFLQQISQRRGALGELNETVKDRLTADFRLSNVFDLQKSFLPTTTQASINEFLGNQTNLFWDIQRWWTNQYQKVKAYQSSWTQDSNLSVSEQVVSYINHKKGKNEYEYYQNIFLTKGYVGEAFWVGKENTIHRVYQVIENWKAGYRGAILLTGKRMSGKSLFGEVVLNRYFANRTIHLFPNSTLSIRNQSIKTTYDLGKALNQIKIYSHGKPFAIWIDNLEMWWDVNISLNKNIRNLKQFMDTYGNDLFFVVAMSDTFKAHISTSQEIDRVFQAEIEMSSFSLEDLEKTISIRHGATHKVLVNARNEPLSQQDFKKITKRIHKASDGNLGEALLLWANAIEITAEDKVSCNFKESLDLPNILNANTATLLTSIVLQKRTTEVRLKYLFGTTAYDEKYSSLVKRLIGVGILTKKIDGWLEINELIVHEVIKMLKRKKYLFDALTTSSKDENY